MQVNSELRVFGEPGITSALGGELKPAVLLPRKRKKDMSKKLEGIRSALYQNRISI
jgi:hypothetical protein